MDDFRLTYDETASIAKTLAKAVDDACDLAQYVSHYQFLAEEGSNRHAEACFRQADAEMTKALRSLKAAWAWVEFGRDQVGMASPEMTALTAIPAEADTAMIVSPVAGMWTDERPMWEIVNSPLAGTESPHWWLYIEDSHKAFGIVKIHAFATFGGNTARPILIEDRQYTGKNPPELARTVADWIEIARPIAESYIAAFDPAKPDPTVAEWQRRIEEFYRKVDGAPEPVPGI